MKLAVTVTQRTLNEIKTLNKPLKPIAARLAAPAQLSVKRQESNDERYETTI
jgi:hypothetical protein